MQVHIHPLSLLRRSEVSEILAHAAFGKSLQLGISPDDEVPERCDAQAALCFEAIGACLAEAGMSFADIVRINAYVTDRAHMGAYMTVRDRYVALPPPASTLMIVSGFTRPEFKVEVEAIAAKA